MRTTAAIPLFLLMLAARCSFAITKLRRAPEEVKLCSIIQNPARYSGHRVSLEADVLADGMHFSLLVGVECRRGIDPHFDEAPAAGDKFGKAIFTGMPGTGDKRIHGKFVGRFRVIPWNRSACREGRMMVTTSPCYVLDVESMSDLKIEFNPGMDPRPPEIQQFPPMGPPEVLPQPPPQMNWPHHQNGTP